MATTQDRFTLRAHVEPALVEALAYPIARQTWTYTREGIAPAEGAELTLEVVWDAMTGEAAPPPCPVCEKGVETAWICRSGHLGCQSCHLSCAGCHDALCADCKTSSCSICHTTSCLDCAVRCPVCHSLFCREHAPECSVCGVRECVNCGGGCATCQKPLCHEHRQGCDRCDHRSCAEHHYVCRTCEAGVCPEHGGECGVCGRGFCADHSSTCSLCQQECCNPCVGEAGRCQTCASLEEIGEGTEHALKTRLAEAAPTVDTDRFRQWYFARNRQTWIIIGRRFWANHLFVLDADRREVRHQRKFWSLRRP